MSSGDKILRVIREDSEAAVAEIRSASEKNCDEIVRKGKAKADEIRKAGEKKKEEQTLRLEKTCQSRVELEKRNAVLKAKRDEINKAVTAAEQYMASLDTAEYFALLYRFAATLRNKTGVIFLNAADLKRVPADFEQQFLKAGVKGKLSKEPDNTIKNGFILKNGDIEDNMSFAAVIADKREAIEDLINRELFLD